jgi:dienelactone hydrolase
MMMRNGYPHMVLDAYVHQVRQIERERRARLSRIQTRTEAEAYQREVREAIARAFSPRPAKTPLNARVTGVVERPTAGRPGRAYRIENVLLESRPGCLVTANLYVPEDLEAPAPCVLGTCGHTEEGKAAGLYQGFCQRLAHAGFVVLIYDPFSQGERDQYYGLPEDAYPGTGTRAHNMMGKQLELLGEFFGMWRAWDSIRALDYLLSRPEVDPSRVGLTGNSGGGTMTTWLWAIEDRFTMAAPGCFVTTFAHNLENELPADAEQCPPGVLGAGLEMADFIIAGAPKPVLLLGQNHDYFDRRGLQEAFADLQHVYAALGAPEGNVGLFIGPQGHGYSAENQKAMVEFFCRHAQLPTGHKAPDVQVDETEVLDPETLFAAPQGQVMAAGATPIYTLIAERAREIGARRVQRTGMRPLDENTLAKGLSRLLALPDERPLPYYRVLRPVRTAVGSEREPDVLARYAVETEGPVRAFLWKRMAQPAYPFTLDVEPDVHLYLPHVASQADLAEEPLAASALPMYALDVRGLGQSLPEEERTEGPYGGFFQPYGIDYMLHAYGLMLGQSYLGRRVYDVLCTMDLLRDGGAESIHLYGRGQGALLALFAALLDVAELGAQVASVTLKNGPSSLLEWTQTPLVTWPAANFCRGILEVCDLPDCVRVLRERLGAENVRIVEPWGPTMG